MCPCLIQIPSHWDVPRAAAGIMPKCPFWIPSSLKGNLSIPTVCGQIPVGSCPWDPPCDRQAVAAVSCRASAPQARPWKSSSPWSQTPALLLLTELETKTLLIHSRNSLRLGRAEFNPQHMFLPRHKAVFHTHGPARSSERKLAFKSLDI